MAEKLDPKLSALLGDVDDLRRRIAHQNATDPTHEVALAMYEADLQRAIKRVQDHLDGYPTKPASRTYIEGRRVA